jgi:hypothetical protein
MQTGFPPNGSYCAVQNHDHETNHKIKIPFNHDRGKWHVSGKSTVLGACVHDPTVCHLDATCQAAGDSQHRSKHASNMFHT